MTVLRRGDTGSLVELMQLSLIRSGYLSGEPDGIFGPDTESALLSFQRNFELPMTGVLNAADWEKLNRFIKGYFIKTVERGDTLWSLAAQYGTTLTAITAANPGLRPNNLQIGEKVTVPFGYSVTPDNISYSSDAVYLVIDGLKARYPFIDLFSIGKSAMEKDIPALSIGSGENELFINAGIHANEWLNIPSVLTFAEEYLYAFITGDTISGENAAQLYENTKLIIAPVINPDGLDLVTGALKSGASFDYDVRIANDYPSIPFPAGWKANIEGIDLNLQFPANWEKARDIKFAQGFVSPAPRDYVGSAPLNAPEARAVYDFTNENNFNMIIAYHSQGNIIYWKYLDYLPPESLRIGEILSDASGYPLELTPEASSYAGYKDWFIQEYNRPGYTVETGSGTNPLPVSDFEDIYIANKQLMAAALREASRLL